MKIIKNYRNIDDSDRGSIIAIGNFDGIHNGHKALINNIIELSKTMDKKTGICTFNPHPKNFFADSQAINQITSQKLKYEDEFINVGKEDYWILSSRTIKYLNQNQKVETQKFIFEDLSLLQ